MQDLSKALTEVRKAYRLLADYQKKVLDLVDFIGNSFGRSYKGGFPKYGRPSPSNGKGSLDLWGWDWLNMYYYSFNFGDEQVGDDKITFKIFLVSDTGYYDNKQSNKGLDKRDTENFKAAEESNTKFIFLVGKNDWKFDGKFDENFNKPEFVTVSEGIQEYANGKAVFKSYSLADFADQEAAEKQLKDFEVFCKINGIKFKLKPRFSSDECGTD